VGAQRSAHGKGFAFEDCREVELKGFDQSVALFEVSGR
jgi:hypothetical protein